MPSPQDDSRQLRDARAELELRMAQATRAEQRLDLRDGVTCALAESSSLEEAAPRILRTVCEALGWRMGALWTVETDLLRCQDLWQTSEVPTAFAEATRQRTFSRGEGMPGRVWATSQPAWIPDVAEDDNFPRAAAAAQEGLRAALGFPIVVAGNVVGVMEFFTREMLKPDAELLRLVSALGSQIGQFGERKRAEVELERFFNLSLDMLCIAGYDGYFKRLNAAWERSLGFTVEELTSRPFLEFVHPDDRAATIAEVQKLAAGANTISFENRYQAKDNSYRWLLWNATPFGQHEVIYAAARDVTERKRAEERIQSLKVEAESANRAKSEFLARMSHEIRTPLNVLLGMGDLLERTALNTEQRQYVRVFQRSGRDLLTLINDILDLSKVESGRIVLEEVDFELPELLEAVIEMMSMRAKEKGVPLHLEIRPGVTARLRGDPDRLRQVLINLLDNALKFTTQGQVLLRVEPAPANPEAGELLFSVVDTGIGIAPGKVDLIFEAFTQADVSTTRRYGGTGLGLAISRRLVELMQGRIWAESELGTGTTFHFTAKFAPAASAAPSSFDPQESPRAIATGPMSQLRILVVDDSEDNRFLVAQYLKDLGCPLSFAENGERAIEMFCAGTYDLVLMDLQMPVIDGYVATRRIRGWEEEQKRPCVPIIALTASALQGELQRALEAGCTAYLRKPVRLVTLLETIAKYGGAPLPGSASSGKIVVQADARLKAAIPGYLHNRRADIAAAFAALRNSDYDRIREIGHKMNGTGSAYGFARLTEIGAALEQAAKDANPSDIRTQVAELGRYLDQLEIV